MFGKKSLLIIKFSFAFFIRCTLLILDLFHIFAKRTLNAHSTKHMNVLPNLFACTKKNINVHSYSVQILSMVKYGIFITFNLRWMHTNSVM